MSERRVSSGEVCRVGLACGFGVWFGVWVCRVGIYPYVSIRSQGGITVVALSCSPPGEDSCSTSALSVRRSPAMRRVWPCRVLSEFVHGPSPTLQSRRASSLPAVWLSTSYSQPTHHLLNTYSQPTRNLLTTYSIPTCHLCTKPRSFSARALAFCPERILIHNIDLRIVENNLKCERG